MGLRGPRSNAERAALNAANQRAKAEESRPLDDRQLRFIEWLVCPKGERKPKYEREFAELLGVTTQTLINWKKMANFKAAWDKRVDQLAGSPERAQAVFDAIFERASQGDVRAAELFLRASGRLQMAPITVTTNSVADLTDEELEALIAETATAERRSRLQVVND